MPPLRVVREGPTVRVTLDRPPLNIMDLDLLVQLRDALGCLGPDVRLVILRGEGTRAFSAGADVGDHDPSRARRMLEAFHGALRILRDAPWVSLAVVRGHCLGGGCELACACDLTLCAADSTFGQPEVKVGSFPPAAAAWWPRLVGAKRAAEMILTGRTLSAAEAHAWGLVNAVHPPDEIEPHADALASRILGQSGAVLALARAALRAGAAAPDAGSALSATERIYLDSLLGLADAREGVEAFRAKRTPRWRHA